MKIQHQQSEIEESFVKELAERLPPVIARNQVEHFLGGIVAAQTLSNADAAGKGPEIAYRVGKKVVYQTDALLRWLVKRKGVSRIMNIKSF